MTATDTKLIVLEDLTSGLIRHEAMGVGLRSQLAYAVRESVTKLGASVNEVAMVTGMSHAEIERILAEPTPLGEPVGLAG